MMQLQHRWAEGSRDTTETLAMRHADPQRPPELIMAEAQLERRLNTKYLLKVFVFVFRPTLTSLERTNASKRRGLTSQRMSLTGHKGVSYRAETP